MSAPGLDTLLGPDALSPTVLLPKDLPVTVGRRGDRVTLQVGNAAPVRLTFAQAIRLGQQLMDEGHAARRDGGRVEITVGRNRLTTDGRAAFRIGRWLQVRGTEAKWFGGHGG